MAYIPVNPERRDPGFFKKKAEIGLPSVDNMSAAEFVNAVSEDVKILGNKKKLSSKITKTGEFYGGLVKTAAKNSHAEFTVGLFDSSDPSKELAAFHVDFVFSCVSSDEFGSVNYTVGCPDGDPFLKNLYIVFSQVDDRVYVTLHTLSLPSKASQVYFNIIGVNLLDWTNGVEKLDSSKDISEIVKNHELARVRLTGPSSTIGSGQADSFSVYDKNGRKISLDDLSSLEDLDFPSINGIPFIGKKDLLIGNEEGGRHITVPAFHKDSTREGSGVHDWEVLGSLNKINIKKPHLGNTTDDTITAVPEDCSEMPNEVSYGYGLVRPTPYKILLSGNSVNTTTDLMDWMNSLGDDTDIITVGAFKEFMYYLLKVVKGVDITPYYLYLDDSKDLFKYVSSGGENLEIRVNSFSRVINGETINNKAIEVSVDAQEEGSTNDWITISNVHLEDSGSNVISCTVKPNPKNTKRRGTIIITQSDTNRKIEVIITQEMFIEKYGLLINDEPYFEDTPKKIEWENGDNWEDLKHTDTFTISPIKTCAADEAHPSGYMNINVTEISLTNTNSWISGKLDGTNLTLSVESNYMSTSRNGVIYIGVLEDEGEKIKYIPIKCSQRSATSYLYIDGNKLESSVIQCSAGKEETIKKFLITSNYTWTISENTIPSWITFSGYSGERPSGDSTLTMVISENNSQSTREAEIKVINKGGTSRIIKVIQTARTVYIDINNQAEDQFYCFGYNGGTGEAVSEVNLTVNSNVNWFIDQCPSWITPSKYDDGLNEKVTKATTSSLKLEPNVPIDGGRNGEEEDTLSLAYFDEENNTIMSLRKINLRLNTYFANPTTNTTGVHVFPQSPRNTDISSEGGTVTLKANANCKYKVFPVSSGDSHLKMFVNPRGYVSEDPNPSGLTDINIDITKNETSTERSFSFVLIPESTTGTAANLKTKFPVYTITQAGSKEIYPIIIKETSNIVKSSVESGIINTISNKDEGIFTNRYTGEIFKTKPTGRATIDKYDNVYQSFPAERGQVIRLINNNTSLYKSPVEITEDTTYEELSGENISFTPVIRDGERDWYEVKEDGYYFTSTGKADLITPVGSKACESKGTNLKITLLTSMNNGWDVYNDTLPSWISLDKISGSEEDSTINVIIDENTKSENRGFDLQFYVDSVDKTVKSLKIEQGGFDVNLDDPVLESVIPILSSKKTTYTSNAFEVGLSFLANYKSSIEVEEGKQYFYFSEYKYTGATFSVSEVDGVSIEMDSYDKPKLVVSENKSGNIREIDVTVTYDGISGSIKIRQGSKSQIQYYTYNDVEVVPDFETIPLGISKFGFKIKAVEVLNTLTFNSETSEVNIDQEIPDSKSEIKFPYLLDKFGVSEDCGIDLISPNTFEYLGNIRGGVSITCPISEYSLNENGVFTEIPGTLTTPEINFETDQDSSTVSVGSTLLSGNKSGETLLTRLSFTNLQGVTITRKDQSTDAWNYITLNIPSDSSDTIYTESLDIIANLKTEPTEYLNNRIITLEVANSETKEILKYIHIRYLKASPKIVCELSDTTCSTNKTFTSSTTTSIIKVSSNIGYRSKAWSNYESGVTITNGSYETANAKLSDIRSIQYKSENQPTRKWYQKYSTEVLRIKDSDNYGLFKEVPIILPVGSGTPSGFVSMTLDNKELSLTGNNGSEIAILPSNDQGEKVLKIKSYEPYTVTVTPASGGDNLKVEDSRNWIQTKVGSLQETTLKIRYLGKNIASQAVNRGTVKISLMSKKTFSISVWQSAGVIGKATITNPASKKLVVGGEENPSVSFNHTASGWLILPTQNETGYTYPKFNGNLFSQNFGGGGNSGISSDKKSTVELSYSNSNISNLNTSLELKPISDFMNTPGEYSIKSASDSILQDSPDGVSFTDSFNVMVKPKSPSYNVCQLDPSTNQLVEVDSLQFTTKLHEFNDDELGPYKLAERYLEFYITSDLFERTIPQINTKLTVNGELIMVSQEDVVFNKLIQKMTLECKFGSSTRYTRTIDPEDFIDKVGLGFRYVKGKPAFKMEIKSNIYDESDTLSNSWTLTSGALTIPFSEFTLDNPGYLVAPAEDLVIPMTKEIIIES